MAAGIEAPALYTIGHGAVELERFIAYLRGAGIESVIDVRRFPGSRRHPQFGSASLQDALRAEGIGYAHVSDLGGRRRPRPDSTNTGLRNEGFRGYADWMEGEAFASGFEALMEAAARERTAVMCAETPWWKCHRRLIADAAVLLRGTPVLHVMGDKVAEHRITAGAVVHGNVVHYHASLSNGADGSDVG